MNAFRHLLTWTTIVVLLTSNIAGLVHVGCLQSNTCCCSDVCDVTSSHRDCDLADTDHCQRDLSVSLRELRERRARAFADSTPSESPSQHDSEHCSICQSFYTSRWGMLLLPSVEVSDSTAPEFSGRVAERVAAIAVRSDDNFLRGPPSNATA
ncbi:hypothetical protein [Rhodopirellula sp. MGV]|uniref:hypothetical protein n=1 Tax=Rhodopirellula sp. MGV TaxID=2023130 RepID=UPI00117BBF31|nr:hypothetical protein [Rhodopirellula sp. MGV]